VALELKEPQSAPVSDDTVIDPFPSPVLQGLAGVAPQVIVERVELVGNLV